MLVTVVAASVTGVAVASYRYVTSSTASLGAGVLAIGDSDGGTALFSLGSLRPGDTQTRCINVTNTGDLSFAALRLDALVTGTGLRDFVDVTVDRGSGAAAGAGFSCTGFSVVTTELFTGTLGAFATASPVADLVGVAAGQVASYRVTVGLAADAALAAQGKTSQLTLTWEASS